MANWLSRRKGGRMEKRKPIDDLLDRGYYMELVEHRGSDTKKVICDMQGDNDDE